jgi:hypothetical protein
MCRREFIFFHTNIINVVMAVGTRSKSKRKTPAKVIRKPRASSKAKGVPVPREVFDTIRSIESLTTAIEPELADGGEDMARQRPEKRRKLGAQFRRIMNGLYGIITGKKGRLALAFLVVIVGIYLTGSHTVVVNTLSKITVGVSGKDGTLYEWGEIASAVRNYDYAATFGAFFTKMKESAQALGGKIFTANTRKRVVGRVSGWRQRLPTMNSLHNRVSKYRGYGAGVYGTVSGYASSALGTTMEYITSFVTMMRSYFSATAMSMGTSSAVQWMMSKFGSSPGRDLDTLEPRRVPRPARMARKQLVPYAARMARKQLVPYAAPQSINPYISSRGRRAAVGQQMNPLGWRAAVMEERNPQSRNPDYNPRGWRAAVMEERNPQSRNPDYNPRGWRTAL